MNIQSVNNISYGIKLANQKNNTNISSVFANKSDVYISSQANSVSFKGNTLDKIRFNTEAQFYVQYARNLMDDVRDVRVDGYDIVESIKEIEQETDVTKTQAGRIYDEVMDSFNKAKDAGYTTVKGDKDSGFASRVFHRNSNNEIVMEDFDKKNRILRKATLNDDVLTVHDYELGDSEYTLYQFDVATNTLRKFGQDVVETNGGFEAEEYLMFDEDGNLETYAIDTKTNKDGSGKIDFLFSFLDPVNLIIYTQDQEITADGTEKSKIEYNFARTLKQRGDKAKRDIDVLSCNVDSTYKPDGTKKVSRIFSYSLENSCITEFKKNFVSDSQDNKASDLTMKFDEYECLGEVLIKSTESDTGEFKAKRMIYYRDEEPMFAYVDYQETQSGEEKYKKMFQFETK